MRNAQFDDEPREKIETPEDILAKEKFLQDNRESILRRNQKLGVQLPELITQKDLIDYMRMEANYNLVKSLYEARKQALINYVQCGVQVEDGLFGVDTDISKTTRPKWKEVVLNRLGPAVIEEEKSKTTPSFSISLKVAVRGTIQDIDDMLMAQE